MTEATVINLFFILRVLIVGGLLLALPRITRKGLLFGVYVGEDFAGGDEGHRLLHGWNRGVGLVMVVSLAWGLTISALGRPLAGNFSGTGVLLLLALVLYLRTYSKARAAAPSGASRQAERAAAPLEGDEPGGRGFALLALGICLLASLATIAYATAIYAAMPERVPALSGIAGGETTLSDRSFVSVMFFPALNLLISPLIAVGALLTTGAKLSVREGDGGRSVKAQEAFRTWVTRVLSSTAVLVCVFLSLISVQLIRFQLGETRSLGIAVWVVAGALLMFMVAMLIRTMRGYGQGGARIEGDPVAGPLAGGLADNAHWVLGLFYVDRHDPSLLVEKRFGIGYALNYGNRTAVLIMVTFTVVTFALVALGLAAIL